MKQNKRTSKGSNDKIPIFAVGDIVKIVPNHKPYTNGITRKYPHGKELINHICFIEEVIGDASYNSVKLEFTEINADLMSSPVPSFALLPTLIVICAIFIILCLLLRRLYFSKVVLQRLGLMLED